MPTWLVEQIHACISFRPWVRLVPREDIVDVSWCYFVGFPVNVTCIIMILGTLYIIFLSFVDTQQNQFPKKLGTLQINYFFLPKLLQSYRYSELYNYQIHVVRCVHLFLDLHVQISQKKKKLMFMNNTFGCFGHKQNQLQEISNVRIKIHVRFC